MEDTTPSLLACIEKQLLSERHIDVLNDLAGGRRVVAATDRATLEAELPRAEIILGDFPRELLARAPQLKWYQQFGTGVDWLLEHPEAARAGFTLTNCSDDHCAVVADHMFALILAVTRGIPDAVRSQARREWSQPERLDSPRHFQLKDKTLLLVGLGSIGREIAARAQGFGMRLAGVRRDPSKPFPGIDRIVGFAELESILPEADIIAVSLPHTRETEKLFGASAFAAMKSGVLFFNVGRGAVVDEAALDSALRSGSLAGGASDVFAEEPLPPDSPLWTAPNFLVSPHLGGFYDRVFETWIDIALDNLRRYDDGQTLRNVVDKSQGY